MTLNFPNRSRSYDATRRAVRFWGYDGALEVSFFVDDDALLRISSAADHGEASLLTSFDANRDRILQSARKVYSRRRLGSYVLGSSDL